MCSVVFAGFSSEAIRDRIVDAQSKWVFTTDEGKRGGKTLPLKNIIDKAVDGYARQGRIARTNARGRCASRVCVA